MSRMALVYNRFSSKTGKTLENIGIEIMGGAQRIEHATTEQILGQLALREMLDKLM